MNPMPFVLPLFAALDLGHGEPSHSAPLPVAAEVEPLDLHLRGAPRAGERLQVEVRGPARRPLLVLVESLTPALVAESVAALELTHGVLPGSRAASARTRALARSPRQRLTLTGVTDSSGWCEWSVVAPEAGTRLLVRGYELGRWPREFEALELDILPRDSAAASGSASLTSPGVSFGGGTPVTPGQGTRPCPTREDVPDLAFDDSNCDGIDGDAARALFVATSGSNGNPGTMELPLASVNLAIQMAAADPQRDYVYVSEGSYSGLVTLLDGVSVWGGYSVSNGWQRSDDYVTTFASGGVVGNGRVGVIGSDLSAPITLGSVTVATATAASNSHNYGILLQSCEDVVLEAVTVVAGSGGAASNGGSGSTGSAGSNGSNGSGMSGGGGGSGAHSGGGGGNGGNLNPNGSDGSTGSGPNGGGGGNGGGINNNGSNGGNGGSGSAGSAGSPRTNVGSVLGGQWTANGDGFSGGTGSRGSGGGGGGGGGITFFQGGGGGGGGGGGFGGTGGSGARAGGSSFALFLSFSSASLAECQLTSGIGRNGGNGGNGGAGGAGGARGFGTNSSNSTDGGDGGLGGSGGAGGTGGGGGGGHSYAVVVDAESSLALTSSTLATSATGNGGAGGNPGVAGEAALIKQL